MHDSGGPESALRRYVSGSVVVEATCDAPKPEFPLGCADALSMASARPSAFVEIAGATRVREGSLRRWG